MSTYLLEGVPSEAPEHIREHGLKKTFFPWHQPRKQYVRIYQWRKELAELLPILNIQDDRPIRYMTLPGDDLLDIRVLSDQFANGTNKLFYLGFNPDLRKADRCYEINLSHNEVRSLPHIDGNSQILPDNFVSIAQEKSSAFEALQKQNGFDAINVDLCHCVAREQPGSIGGYYDTLRILLEQQANKRLDPWLLFLSTHVSMSSVNHDAMERLIKSLDDNIVRSSDFKEKLQNVFSVPTEDLAEKIKYLMTVAGAASKNNDIAWDSIVGCFCLGLGKWLLKIMLGADPRWKVQLKTSYCYSVSNKERDFVSLCFFFEPLRQPRTDPLGLSTNIGDAGKNEEDMEANFAIDMIPHAHGIIDIESLLKNDSICMKDIVTKIIALLESCRYDIAEYKRWLKNKGISVPL